MQNSGIPLSDTFTKYLANSNPGLVAVVRSEDFRILFVNKQFEHYLGYTESDLQNNDLYFTQLMEEYHHDRFLHQLRFVDENIAARSEYVIYRLRNNNRNVQPYYLYASPFVEKLQEYGKLYFILLLPDHSKWGMPFTSFNSKELFLEQFNSDHFGTFEWILGVDKVFWSAGVYRIFEIGEDNQEMNRLFTELFIHPADAERVKDETRKAIESSKDLNIEYRIITGKQNVKLLHCLARIIAEPGGQSAKFAGSIRDITNQRMIEEDLKKKVEELNHSNKELEEFAYIASHDMQEPLRKITTFSDRLYEKYKDALTGDGALYLSRMIASAENMRSLINSLLDFSRISKTEQPFEKVKLNVVLREVKTDLELTIEETGTVINAPLLPEIEAVSSQMKQLFLNIISNAIKFRKPNVPPQVNIDVAVLADSDKLQYELHPSTAYYKITITDNGIGFENEYATRIFQVFQRLHGKSEYPGSGIGLAICKKILEYHHGIIYAENIPGVGARFVFIIPEKQTKG